MDSDRNLRDVEEVTRSEAARVRARDRKRSVRMVVDNAGVRRILLERGARRRAAPERGPGSEAP
jgi:hypothetical protein